MRPSAETAAIAAFLEAAGDHLHFLEVTHGNYGWPRERPTFTPAQGRAVLAWLGSRLMAQEEAQQAHAVVPSVTNP